VHPSLAIFDKLVSMNNHGYFVKLVIKIKNPFSPVQFVNYINLNHSSLAAHNKEYYHGHGQQNSFLKITAPNIMTVIERFIEHQLKTRWFNT